MEEIIKDNAIRGLQNVIEISGALVHLRKEYAKVILELLKEQEDTINELQNAYCYLQKQFFEAQDKLLKEQDNEAKRIMKVVWDTLHEGVSIDTVPDQDWVYELIRHRIEDR